MKRIFKVIAEAAVSYYDELLHLVLMGFVTLVSCLLILPGPFALAGLWYVAHRAVRRTSIYWRDYWEGVKRYGLRAWGVILIVLFGYVLIFSNIWFYNTPQISPIENDSIVLVITSFWIALIMLWTCTAFYVSAALIEQERGGLLRAVRNSLFLTFVHPIPTLMWVFFSGLLLVISVLIPILLLVTPAYILVLSFTGFRSLVLPILEAHEVGEDGREEAASASVEESVEEGEDNGVEKGV